MCSNTCYFFAAFGVMWGIIAIIALIGYIAYRIVGDPYKRKRGAQAKKKSSGAKKAEKQRAADAAESDEEEVVMNVITAQAGDSQERYESHLHSKDANPFAQSQLSGNHGAGFNAAAHHQPSYSTTTRGLAGSGTWGETTTALPPGTAVGAAGTSDGLCASHNAGGSVTPTTAFLTALANTPKPRSESPESPMVIVESPPRVSAPQQGDSSQKAIGAHVDPTSASANRFALPAVGQVTATAVSGDTTPALPSAGGSAALPSSEAALALPSAGVSASAPPAENSVVLPSAGVRVGASSTGATTGSGSGSVGGASPSAGATVSTPSPGLTTAAPSAWATAPQSSPGNIVTAPSSEAVYIMPSAGVAASAPSAGASVGGPSAGAAMGSRSGSVGGAVPSAGASVGAPSAGVSVTAPSAGASFDENADLMTMLDCPKPSSKFSF